MEQILQLPVAFAVGGFRIHGDDSLCAPIDQESPGRSPCRRTEILIILKSGSEASTHPRDSVPADHSTIGMSEPSTGDVLLLTTVLPIAVTGMTSTLQVFLPVIHRPKYCLAPLRILELLACGPEKLIKVEGVRTTE